MTTQPSANSMRIIIDIHDARNFNWDRATTNWKTNMPDNLVGHATKTASNHLGYVWYKANPLTNIPLITNYPSTIGRNMMFPLAGVSSSGGIPVGILNDITRMIERLDVLERMVLRLKTVHNSEVTGDNKQELISDIKALHSDFAKYIPAVV